MNSSTSSSDWVFVKIFLAIVLGMGAAMGIVRVFVWLNDASAETIIGRVMEAKAALPEIVATEVPVVMVYGSSLVQAAFSPREFDQQLAELGTEVKSFNFGFGGLNPYFQDFLSRRIHEEFDAGGKRLKLAIIEFNPFQATQSRWQGALSSVDSFITMLANDQEIREISLQDPERGALLFNIKYLRNDISAEMITSFYGRPFRSPRARSQLQEDQQAEKVRDELGQLLNQQFEKDYPDYGGEEWGWGWQGGGTIPSERSAETLEIVNRFYAAGQTDYRMDNDRLFRIDCCDILEMNFEPLLVEAFIRIVHNFQQFSDQVEVILLPRNTDWIEYTPEARQRLEYTISAIEAATGVSVRNYQSIDAVNNKMFADTTHLNRYQGAVGFTGFLVDQYADDLRQH